MLEVHSGTLGMYMPWAYDSQHLAKRNRGPMLSVLEDTRGVDQQGISATYRVAGCLRASFTIADVKFLFVLGRRPSLLGWRPSLLGVGSFSRRLLFSLHDSTLHHWSLAARCSPPAHRGFQELDSSHCKCPFGAAGKEVGYDCPGTSPLAFERIQCSKPF